MAKIKELIAGFVEDVATLDVLTLSGTISLKPAPDVVNDAEGNPTEAKKIKWDAFFKDVVEKIQTPAEGTQLNVVAYTHAEFDHDSVNFYRTADGDDGLAELHRKTVEAAAKARMEAVAAFGRVLKIGG